MGKFEIILLASVILLLFMIVSSLIIWALIYFSRNDKPYSNDLGLDVSQGGSYILINGKPIRYEPPPNIPPPNVPPPDIPDDISWEDEIDVSEIYKNCAIRNTLAPEIINNTVRANLDKYVKNIKFIQDIGEPNSIRFYNFDYVTNRFVANIDGILYCGYINVPETMINNNNKIILDITLPNYSEEGDTNIILSLDSPSYVIGNITVNGEIGEISADL